MRMSLVAGTMLILCTLAGCSKADDVHERTRKECQEDPALSGCSYGLPMNAVERQRERAERQSERQAARRADREDKKLAAKTRKWLRQTHNPVSINDLLADGADDLANITGNASSAGTDGSGTPAGRRCWDVTSYDYDWSNDVLCQRVDGFRFYTSYSGADAFLRES